MLVYLVVSFLYRLRDLLRDSLILWAYLGDCLRYLSSDSLGYLLRPLLGPEHLEEITRRGYFCSQIG